MVTCNFREWRACCLFNGQSCCVSTTSRAGSRPCNTASSNLRCCSHARKLFKDKCRGVDVGGRLRCRCSVRPLMSWPFVPELVEDAELGARSAAFVLVARSGCSDVGRFWVSQPAPVVRSPFCCHLFKVGVACRVAGAAKRDPTYRISRRALQSQPSCLFECCLRPVPSL